MMKRVQFFWEDTYLCLYYTQRIYSAYNFLFLVLKWITLSNRTQMKRKALILMCNTILRKRYDFILEI